MSTRKMKLRTSVAVLAAVALAAGAVGLLGAVPGGASSHREAPLVSADPQVDNTDVYAFVSPDNPDTVTLISNWIPFEEPAGGPNFYPWGEGVRYDIKIDNDGDAQPDIIYRWVFKDHVRNGNTFLTANGAVTSLTDENLNFYQTYDLLRIDVGRNKNQSTRLVNDAVSVPSHAGAATMPDYEALFDEGITSCGSSCQTFAGQGDDPFFLDLRVFDLLYGGDLSEVGDDTLAGFNTNVMAIQVSKDDLALAGDAEENPTVGVWSTAARKSTRIDTAQGGRKSRGRYQQVSRLGMPLVNEVVIPLAEKDFFNASKPVNDLANFGSFVVEPELPELIEAVYGIAAPPTPRDDLVQVFVTGIPNLNQPANVVPGEMIRLNMSIAPCLPDACGTYSPLGVIGGDTAGYPNGRRLADDTIDISLQVVEGELVGTPNDLGDGVNANDLPFRSAFPYVALPHAGSDASPH